MTSNIDFLIDLTVLKCELSEAVFAEKGERRGHKPNSNKVFTGFPSGFIRSTLFYERQWNACMWIEE